MTVLLIKRNPQLFSTKTNTIRPLSMDIDITPILEAEAADMA
jgi:hypothetical protein